jgi:hypothetical protein
MKIKKIKVAFIAVIIIGLFIILYFNIQKRENFDNATVSLYSWWGEDARSKQLFSEIFDIPEINAKYKHINIYSVFGDIPNIKRDDTLYVQYSGEHHFNDPSIYDINFIPTLTPSTDSNIIIFPYAMHYLLVTKTNLNSFLVPRSKMKKHKTKFCIFSVSNGNCKERNDFFNKLSEYKTVDSCGKFMNNMNRKCPGEFESTEYCDFLSDYKFMICFENVSKDNYFTEKLINAYKCNTIPIYWGCSNINEYVNMNAILYLKPNFTIEDVRILINEIKNLNENENLYNEKYYQPLFTEQNISNNININKLQEKIRNLILQ